MAYNPYEAASNIVSQKKKWADAYAKGEDTSPYEQSAKAYYEELRSNGRQDVADKLNASDDITASEYLKTLAPGYNAANYNPQNAVKGVYNAKVAYDEAKATGQSTQSAEDSARAYYAELRENGYSDAADYLSKNGATAAGTYLNRFSPSYSGSSEGNTAKSNDVYAVGKNYGDDIKNTYDRVYSDTINVDPTSTDYGKNVLSSYRSAADEAYNKAFASNTESAGGNADSYAAANANRQKAAVVSNAHSDILNYYNAITSRANDWAADRSSALSQNLSALQSNVDNDRTSRQIDAQNDTERYLQELQYKSEDENRSYDRETSLRDYLTTMINAYGVGVLDFIDDNGNFDRAKLAAARNEDGTYGPDRIAFKGGLTAADTSSVIGSSAGSGIRSTASSATKSGTTSGATKSGTTSGVTKSGTTSGSVDADDGEGDGDEEDKATTVTRLETLDDVRRWVNSERTKPIEYGEDKFTASFNAIFTAANKTDDPAGYIRNLVRQGEYSEENVDNLLKYCRERGLNVNLYATGTAYTPTKAPFETLVREAVMTGLTEEGILERLRSQYANGQYTDTEYEEALKAALGEDVAQKYI